jgi:hypothetical protein
MTGGRPGGFRMRIAKLLRKLPIPALLSGGMVISITGSSSIGSETISEALSSLDDWVLPHIKHPTAALFFAGLLAAWIIYQPVNFVVYEKRQRARIKLAELRDTGVAIRNECITMLPSRLPAWMARAEQWDTDATKAIAQIDHADSMWFATLDALPPARVPMSPLSAQQQKLYREHDFRLVKLEQLMNRYAGES